VFLLRVLCFFAISGSRWVPAGRALLGISGWIFLSTAIYLLNGITDIVGDRANGSRRPLACGLLNSGSAARVTGVLSSAGLILCALASTRLVVVGIVLLALGWCYSMGPVPLKSTPVGFPVAVGGGALLSYLAGAVLAGGVGRYRAVFAVSMAVWVGLCSATKDFSDVEGDLLAGRRTWSVVLGDRPARRLTATLSAVLGLWFLVISSWLPRAVGLAALVAAVGSVALAVAALAPVGGADRRSARRPYRVFMTVQYAVNGCLLGCRLLAAAG
jgi:4-hydroxybenzoate polyprenyltransferase/chlorophyll synthase